MQNKKSTKSCTFMPTQEQISDKLFRYFYYREFLTKRIVI